MAKVELHKCHQKVRKTLRKQGYDQDAEEVVVKQDNSLCSQPPLVFLDNRFWGSGCETG